MVSVNMGEALRFATCPAILLGRPSRTLLGFAYGYRGAPGQFWHDLTRTFLDPELSARWVDDVFKLVEFIGLDLASRDGSS